MPYNFGRKLPWQLQPANAPVNQDLLPFRAGVGGGPQFPLPELGHLGRLLGIPVDPLFTNNDPNPYAGTVYDQGMRSNRQAPRPVASRRRLSQRVAAGAFGQPRGPSGSLADVNRPVGPEAALLPMISALAQMMSPDAQSFGSTAAPQGKDVYGGGMTEASPLKPNVDPLANLPMIPSLQNEPQQLARALAEEVEAGKISMADAVSRYRAFRFK